MKLYRYFVYILIFPTHIAFDRRADKILAVLDSAVLAPAIGCCKITVSASTGSNVIESIEKLETGH